MGLMLLLRGEGIHLRHILSPCDRYDSATSDPATPTSHPILEVEHLLPLPKTQPDKGCGRQQSGVRTSGAIDLHEVARPKILYSGRVKRHHLCARVLCSFRP
jgi:hypothetical protein